MSKLDAFLHPVETEQTKEVIISKRFRDEKGKPVPFKIKAITQEENDRLIKQSTRRTKENGGYVENLDKLGYNHKLILACVVEPDLRDAELCASYNTVDPEEVAGRMLLSGEYRTLIEAILSLNGFNDDLDEDAKNS